MGEQLAALGRRQPRLGGRLFAAAVARGRSGRRCRRGRSCGRRSRGPSRAALRRSRRGRRRSGCSAPRPGGPRRRPCPPPARPAASASSPRSAAKSAAACTPRRRGRARRRRFRGRRTLRRISRAAAPERRAGGRAGRIMKVGGDLSLAYRDPRSLASQTMSGSVDQPHLDASNRRAPWFRQATDVPAYLSQLFDATNCAKIVVCCTTAIRVRPAPSQSRWR